MYLVAQAAPPPPTEIDRRAAANTMSAHGSSWNKNVSSRILVSTYAWKLV